MNKDLARYCNYLIMEYRKIMVGNGGKVYTDLQQYLREGGIKDLISINSSIESKINILNIYRDKIVNFAISKGLFVDIMDFRTFIKN